MNLPKFRILEALDIKVRRSLSDKTSEISDPPVFNSKHHNMFLAFIVNVESF